MAAVLPSGVSESGLARALEALAAALGPGAVLTSEQDLREFRDPYAFPTWDEFTASAVVMPASVEEVQAVVRIAGEHRVPLWTFSQGRNNPYGGPAPRVRGSVLVNLRRMNRVLEVNDELACALVEPGVRYFDLYDHLRAGGHRLWPSVPDLGWGSVLGNAVDHGRGYGRYGDHAASACGMEVVLASGEVLRTGMGALAAGRTWQAYPRGFGPSADGIFMQSNLGIVTKMGVWLMPQPESYVSFWVRARGEAGLAALVDTVRPLLLNGTIPNCPLVRRGVGIGAWNVTDEEWGDAGGSIPEHVMQRIIRERGTDWWAMRFALYGPQPVVDVQLRLVEAAFETIPGAELGARRYAGADVHAARIPDDKAQAGVPGQEHLELMERLSGEAYGHLDFSPIGPLTGRDVLAMTRLIGPIFERRRLRYTPGLILTPRCVFHIGTTVFDTSNEEEARAAFDAYEEAVVATARAGYGVYRAHLRFMDLVADQYDWGDHVLRRFNETLKDALDPDGILSPGKQGIWPRSMRPAR